MADVVVIGSGASGGMAAYNLTQKGVKVLLLDAGDGVRPPLLLDPHAAVPGRRAAAQGRRAAALLPRQEGAALPDAGGQALRPHARVGPGRQDEHLGPRQPALCRISTSRPPSATAGGSRGRSATRTSRPTTTRRSSSWGCAAARRLRRRCRAAGADARSRSALRRGVPPEGLRQAADPGRGGPPRQLHAAAPRLRACHYCGACGQGCDTASFFNSADHLIPQALETGNLEIQPNAVVARVLVDANGRASGVQYFDRKTGAERQVKARVVVLGASAMDSTRILLNSKSTRLPERPRQRIRRARPQLLRAEHGPHARLPAGALRRAGYTNDDGIGGEHVYMPRFNHRPDGPSATTCAASGCSSGTRVRGDRRRRRASTLPGFGAAFKAEVKKRYPALVSLHPFGEVLPLPENRVTVDERRRDRYGVPLMKIDVAFGDNERKMRKHMYDTCQEILETRRPRSCRTTARRTTRPARRSTSTAPAGWATDPKTLGAQRLQPDARGDERLRGGRLGVHQRVGEESDPDASWRSRGAPRTTWPRSCAPAGSSARPFLDGPRGLQEEARLLQDPRAARRGARRRRVLVLHPEARGVAAALRLPPGAATASC